MAMPKRSSRPPFSMNSGAKIIDLVQLLWGCFWGPLWVFALHPALRGRRHKHWVVGGHRGRLYSDNARALEREARRRGRRIYWIANPSSRRAISKQGPTVLVRHSWAARRAISTAEALIYSHGEDDLDAMMAWLRGRTALRCYLNHGHNLLKAGGVYEPGWDQQPRLIRAFRAWLITDCDRFFCVSSIEQSYFELSYPMHRGKFRLGGGAHLDDFLPVSASPRKTIFWFPTFRQSQSARQALQDHIWKVIRDPRLQAWLEEHDYQFLIGGHINSDPDSSPSLPHRFRLVQPADIADTIKTSEVLVSDYSSVLFDFLLFERAPILFAFDLQDYCKSRYLYQDYSSINYAVHVNSPHELVAALCSRATHDPSLLGRVRAARHRFLPEGDRFAAQTYDAILHELAAHCEDDVS